MTTPANILQRVTTYASSMVGILQNQNCFISEFNTKYKNFQNLPANLGNSVNIQLPSRAIVKKSLVANFAPAEMNLQPLTCDQAFSSANAFNDQNFTFEVEEYLDTFGRARVSELGAEIESIVALNADSSVPVMTVDQSGNSVPTGALHTESGPFLFYGDGTNPINSFGQLAKIEALQGNFGAPAGKMKVFLDDLAVVDIVNSGLNQFVPGRNEKLANSWDLGTYKGSNCDYFKSNLLPIHTSGTTGDNRDTLTLVRTNDPTGAAITQLTFSGVSVNAGAIKSGDLIQFDAGQGLVYLTWTGHKPSKNLVQVRATADADASAGTVIVNIYPALQWTVGLNQNLNRTLVAGMTAHNMPSHRCGLLVSGDAAFISMPPLPGTTPFPSSTQTDPETMVSLRMYYGYMFPQNATGLINDAIMGTTVVPQYSRRILFPLDQI